MIKTLPVGSIICINKRKYMIAGYLFDRISDSIMSLYLIVKYPHGFAGENSIAAIPQNSKFDVIHKGYLNTDIEEYLSAQESFEDEMMRENPEDIGYFIEKAEIVLPEKQK